MVLQASHSSSRFLFPPQVVIWLTALYTNSKAEDEVDEDT
jgi:hypothetical protein